MTPNLKDWGVQTLGHHKCVGHVARCQGPDRALQTRMLLLADQECPPDQVQQMDHLKHGDADRVAHALVWVHSAFRQLWSDGIRRQYMCGHPMSAVCGSGIQDISNAWVHHVDSHTDQPGGYVTDRHVLAYTCSPSIGIALGAVPVHPGLLAEGVVAHLCRLQVAPGFLLIVSQES